MGHVSIYPKDLSISRSTYLSTANHTLVLIVPEAAFIADADEGCRTNVGIADGAFAIAFIAKSTDGNARLLATHNEITATRCQFLGLSKVEMNGTYG